MNSPLRPTYVRVHLDRLMTNFERLKSFNPGEPFICPMIKANGYGHGDVAVAKALEKKNCEFFGVASVEEGANLRENYVSSNVLCFGFYGVDAVKELLHQKLTPVVSTFNQLELLACQAKNQKVNIHLKFNTGMNRLGFVLEDVPKLLQKLSATPQLVVDGLCTHLHTGENICKEGQSSKQQVKAFQEICGHFKQPISFYHVYNSAATAALYSQKATFRFGARPGLLVYGIDPAMNLSLKPLVSPVMEFKSSIVSTHVVKSGEVVSYGGTWKASRDSLIGIVPAGYGDGINRGLSNRGEVLVCGKRVPIRGRVCMDYTMVDLTDLEKDSLAGEEVVFIGSQGDQSITVEDVANVSGRITYEVMTGISERVPRLYGVN